MHHLERFRFDRTHSSLFSLTAADLKVRASAGAPDCRRAAVAASSDSSQTGIALATTPLDATDGVTDDALRRPIRFEIDRGAVAHLIAEIRQSFAGLKAGAYGFGRGGTISTARADNDMPARVKRVGR